jgi:hypothetical protein
MGLFESFRHSKVDILENDPVLQYNELESLPFKLKRALPNVQKMLIDGNPWYCDTELKWLSEWLKTSDIVFYTNEAPVTFTFLMIASFDLSIRARNDLTNPGLFTKFTFSAVAKMEKARKKEKRKTKRRKRKRKRKKRKGRTISLVKSRNTIRPRHMWMETNVLCQVFFYPIY